MSVFFNKLFERRSVEHEFLPAALEVQQSPPSPIGRAVMWSIVSFLTLMLLWSCLSDIDIIAIAPGKIVPNDRVKTIQPLESAVVSKILVRDGDVVTKGQVLIELDTRQTQSDVDNLMSQLYEKRARLVALNALEAAVSNKPIHVIPKLQFAEGTPEVVRIRQQHLFQEQIIDFNSALLGADHNIEKQQEDLATSGSEVTKLEQQVPLITKKTAAYKELMTYKAVGEVEYLDQEQRRIEMVSNLSSERLRSRSLHAALDQARQNRAKLISETRVGYGKEKYDLVTQVESAKQELIKAQARNGLQTLTSPIDGVIQGLSTFTVGGVVSPAEKIMSVVPTEGGLEIEAYVTNKDIGFVHRNQDVTVKVDSFNFTKYGTIEGTVLDISKDAFEDEKLGSVFKARIGLAKAEMVVDGKTINLGSGMTTTNEVTTGSRKVIEFLLNPVRAQLQESWSER